MEKLARHANNTSKTPNRTNPSSRVAATAEAQCHGEPNTRQGPSLHTAEQPRTERDCEGARSQDGVRQVEHRRLHRCLLRGLGAVFHGNIRIGGGHRKRRVGHIVGVVVASETHLLNTLHSVGEHTGQRQLDRRKHKAVRCAAERCEHRLVRRWCGSIRLLGAHGGQRMQAFKLPRFNHSHGARLRQSDGRGKSTACGGAAVCDGGESTGAGS